MFGPRTVLFALFLVIHLFATNARAQNLDLIHVEPTSDDTRPGPSEQDARLALETAEAGSSTDPQIAMAANNLAVILLRAGRAAESKPLFERALRIVEDRPKSDQLLRAAILNGLATTYWKLGDFSHAMSLLKQAIAQTKYSGPPADSFLPKLLNDLGLVYATIGSMERAESSLRSALQLIEARGGNDRYRLRIMLNLGLVYIHRQNWPRAESVLLRAETIADASDPKMAAILNGLGTIYYNRRNLDAADTAFRRAFDIWVVALGPRDPNVGFVDANLADVLSTRGEYEAARKLYTESLDIQEQSGLTRTVQFAKTLESYGQVLRKLKDTTDAEQVATRARMIRAELAYTVPIQRAKRQQ